MSQSLLYIWGNIKSIINIGDLSSKILLKKYSQERKLLSQYICDIPNSQLNKLANDKSIEEYLNDLITTKKDVHIAGTERLGVSKKGSPFIELQVMSFKVKKIHNRDKKLKNIKASIKLDLPIKEGPKWYELVNNSECISIPSHLVETVLLSTNENINVSLEYINKIKSGFIKPRKIVVSDNGDGTYKLLVGLKSLLSCKLAGVDVVAHVTDLTREEFVKKYYVE